VAEQLSLSSLCVWVRACVSEDDGIISQAAPSLSVSQFLVSALRPGASPPLGFWLLWFCGLGVLGLCAHHRERERVALALSVAC